MATPGAETLLVGRIIACSLNAETARMLAGEGAAAKIKEHDSRRISK
jgi:hypothetical protein